VNIIIIIGMMSLIIIALPILTRPLMHQLQALDWFWIVGLQEMPIVIIAWILNSFYIKQAVFYRPSGSLKSLTFISSPVLILLLAITLSITFFYQISFKSLIALWPILIGTTFIGISEEYLFRGLIFPQILKAIGTWTHKDLYSAIGISSLLFALIHVLNLTGQDLTATVIQMVNAFSIGCLFCAIYIRSGSLLLPIVFHSLWNFGIFGLDGAILTPRSIFWMIIFNTILLAITTYDLREQKLSQRDIWIEKLVS
ncbi:MAG: CPBP family intramembrane glutamic endopeptidase, partial [Lentilactobacillus hilgardii]